MATNIASFCWQEGCLGHLEIGLSRITAVSVRYPTLVYIKEIGV
jgi:hypothetical protein